MVDEHLTDLNVYAIDNCLEHASLVLPLFLSFHFLAVRVALHFARNDRDLNTFDVADKKEVVVGRHVSCGDASNIVQQIRRNFRSYVYINGEELAKIYL